MSLSDMLCKTFDEVQKAAPIPGRYAVWSRDKWDAPEFLDLWFTRDEQGNSVREWYGVTGNMMLGDGMLLGCVIEPDWRPV